MEGEISKDVYLEIARVADDRTILKMLSVNKRFNSSSFFQEVISRKYPSLFQFKKNDEDWKHFYLRIVKYTAKLREEFEYILPLDQDPEILYKKKFCKRLLNKIEKWRNIQLDDLQLKPAPNIYNLLYNSETFGSYDNPEAIASYLIDEADTTFYNTEYADELKSLSPEGIFGENSALYKLTHDMTPVNSLLNRDLVIYDYNLLLEILKKNGKSFKNYQKLSGMSLEMVKNYPKRYAAKLSENFRMHDTKYLHKKIRSKTDKLVRKLVEESETDMKYEQLILTDEEIDFLLSIHRRILDPNDNLTIISLVKCKNLI